MRNNWNMVLDILTSGTHSALTSQSKLIKYILQKIDLCGGCIDLLRVRLSNVTFLIFQLSSSKTHFRWHRHSYYYCAALHVFGSEAVVAGGGGGCVSRWLSEVHFLIKAAGPPTEPQRFEWRNAEATHAAHFTGWYCCTIDLTTRRCSRPSDWIYCANMVSMLSFTHHCQLPSCVPCLFLSSSICNRFLWLMVKHWLILTHLSMF